MIFIQFINMNTIKHKNMISSYFIAIPILIGVLYPFVFHTTVLFIMFYFTILSLIIIFHFIGLHLLEHHYQFSFQSIRRLYVIYILLYFVGLLYTYHTYITQFVYWRE